LGKIITPFTSLRMPVASENESRSFWGLDLAILLLCAPFLMLWEVAMVRPTGILHVVYLANAQGGKFDQPALVREFANIVRTWFHD
jgi:hypothetical protein